MKQLDASIVRVTNAEGETLGTGFLISDDGLIATCAHMVEGTEPRIAFPAGEPRPAQIMTTDEIHDVAILRLEGELPEGAQPARLGRSIGAYHREFWSRGYRPSWRDGGYSSRRESTPRRERVPRRGPYAPDSQEPGHSERDERCASLHP